MDLRQIQPRNPIQGSAHIEGGRIDLATLRSCLGQCRSVARGSHGQRSNGRLKFTITFGNFGLVKVVEVQRLAQGKDMLIAVIAIQCGADCLYRRMATHIAKSHQNIRVPFSRDDGADVMPFSLQRKRLACGGVRPRDGGEHSQGFGAVSGDA